MSQLCYGTTLWMYVSNGYSVYVTQYPAWSCLCVRWRDKSRYGTYKTSDHSLRCKWQRIRVSHRWRWRSRQKLRLLSESSVHHSQFIAQYNIDWKLWPNCLNSFYTGLFILGDQCASNDTSYSQIRRAALTTMKQTYINIYSQKTVLASGKKNRPVPSSGRTWAENDDELQFNIAFNEWIASLSVVCGLRPSSKR